MFGVVEPDMATMLRLELTELRRVVAQVNSERKITPDMVEIKYEKIADQVLMSLRREDPEPKRNDGMRNAAAAMRAAYRRR